jgi:hypothetical protein
MKLTPVAIKKIQVSFVSRKQMKVLNSKKKNTNYRIKCP